MDIIEPRDSREEVALYRAGIIGDLVHTELVRGELKRRLEQLSTRKFRPPNSDRTRSYGVSTLERWYYAYKRDGIEGLKPKARSDRGHGRHLPPELKQLILEIRRVHRTASASLIRDTLICEGRMDPTTASVSTFRRLYREHDLRRLPKPLYAGVQRQRLRWQAAHPGALWHGDVCHGPSIEIDGVKRPLRIHALMDDASRYVVALEAHHTEREIDMVHLFADALRRHPKPDALYLDNGSTYRGKALQTACSRMEIGLIHARPYDPQARGKMERFWRTLRGRCLDHLSNCTSLHDVQVRLSAFLHAYYHPRPHAGLFSKTPCRVWNRWWRHHEAMHVDESKMREAMTVRNNRRVRNDSTLRHAGGDWQLDGSYLTSSTVVVAHSLLDDPVEPWVEVDDRRLELHPVDPVKNGERRRTIRQDEVSNAPVFRPTQALLDSMLGRTSTTNHNSEGE